MLLPVAAAQVTPARVHGEPRADLRWAATAGALAAIAGDAPLEAGACAYAAQLAGAMERVLAITVAYANERDQFGRPIGKFQAIQHQLA